ncbi:MAG: DUF6113 family protein [Nocardioidaceae bacterium]
MSAFVRVLGLVAVGLLGAVTGVAGLFVSRMDVQVSGVPVPYGLVLAIVAATLVFRLGRSTLGPGGAVAGVVGWLVPVVAALWPRPEGDIVVGGDGFGAGFVLLGVMSAAWTLARGLRARDDLARDATSAGDRPPRP